jgi:hypothetical protein
MWTRRELWKIIIPMIAKSLVDKPDGVDLFARSDRRKNNSIETESRKKRFTEGYWQAGENSLSHGHYPERDGA